MAHKRFSKGAIPWWPDFDGGKGKIDSKNFILLIYGGDLRGVNFKEDWKKI